MRIMVRGEAKEPPTNIRVLASADPLPIELAFEYERQTYSDWIKNHATLIEEKKNKNSAQIRYAAISAAVRVRMNEKSVPENVVEH